MTRTKGFEPGKIPQKVLTHSVYPYLGQKSRRILAGPGVARDAAIVEFDKRILVFSTDPITGATNHIGKHAIHINANDVAVAGARPSFFLLTILLPPGSQETKLRSIMKEVDEEARRLGVSVVRGHTEATPDLIRPIIAGFMIGESEGRRFLSADGGEEDDSIILTKTAGIEGTAVLASDHSRLLERKRIDQITIRRAQGLMDSISVVPEARIASRIDGVNAMHDPTEGGVLNGIWELAEASDSGVMINANLIPIAQETRLICERLSLDPLRLLSSGSLLIACRPSKTSLVLKSISRHGTLATEIGRLTSPKEGRRIQRDNRELRLLPVNQDELYRV